MMLMNHHPLLGAREYRIRLFDEKAQVQLYGREPVFVFDPADDSNRPVPGYHDTVLATWEAAPASLRALFTRAFTDGLRQPGLRVRETQWRDALSAIRDMIISCQGCGRQNMTDPGEIGSRRCWSCGTMLTLPPVVQVTTVNPARTRTIALAQGVRVYSHHLTPDPPRHDFTAAATVAVVVEHPRVPGRLGLRNLTVGAWTAHARTDPPSIPHHKTPAACFTALSPSSAPRTPLRKPAHHGILPMTARTFRAACATAPALPAPATTASIRPLSLPVRG